MSSLSTKSPDRETVPAGADEQLVEAVKKHQSGQVHEAVAIYAAVLEATPDHVDALHFLGVAEHQLGDSHTALQHIGRALELALDHADARNNRSFSKSGGRLRGDVCRPHEGALFYDIG
jgi:Flp pilus assembly protein TadD